MTYDIGDVVKLTATITDPDSGEKVDPTKVTCTVLTPAGAKETPEVTKDEKGVYTAEVEAGEAGRYYFAFDGTGGVQASEEGDFTVRKQAIPR